MSDRTETTVLLMETRAERIERAMNALTFSVPNTKGMGPKDRALRLHAELERRIALAKDALKYVQVVDPIALADLTDQLKTIVAESGNPTNFDAAAWLSRWLDGSLAALGGARPIDLMNTKEGQARVSQALAQMQSGAYA
jgi:Protein of unknown function (DUF2384)